MCVVWAGSVFFPSMERIKETITANLTRVYGSDTIVELDTSNHDTCLKICIHSFPRYAIYIRPDAFGREFVCHYVCMEDLRALEADPDDMKKWNQCALLQHEWKRQQAVQLPMRVQGRHHEFLECTMWYTRIALDRIRAYGGGRLEWPVQRTFAEAEVVEVLFPEPR